MSYQHLNQLILVDFLKKIFMIQISLKRYSWSRFPQKEKRVFMIQISFKKKKKERRYLWSRFPFKKKGIYDPDFLKKGIYDPDSMEFSDSLCTQLMYVSPCWSANTSVSMCRSPYENVTCQFDLISPIVPSISCSSYLDCLWVGR